MNYRVIVHTKALNVLAYRSSTMTAETEQTHPCNTEGAPTHQNSNIHKYCQTNTQY